jgi:hypothetical protein
MFGDTDLDPELSGSRSGGQSGKRINRASEITTVENVTAAEVEDIDLVNNGNKMEEGDEVFEVKEQKEGATYSENRKREEKEKEEEANVEISTETTETDGMLCTNF